MTKKPDAHCPGYEMWDIYVHMSHFRRYHLGWSCNGCDRIWASPIGSFTTAAIRKIPPLLYPSDEIGRVNLHD